MSTIEALRTEPDDPGLTAVVVEGRIVSVVPTHEIELLGLSVGHLWDEDTEARVQHSLLVDRARREALILLADGSAEHELTGQLHTQGHTFTAIADAMQHLYTDGWLTAPPPAVQNLESDS